MRRLLPLLALLCLEAQAVELTMYVNRGASDVLTPCFPLYGSDDDGATAQSGITSASTNFVISLQADNEGAATEFAGAADIETHTVGAHGAGPTANTDVLFTECASSGRYQLGFHDDHMNKSNASYVIVWFVGDAIIDQTILIDHTRASLSDLQAQNEAAIEASHPFMVTGNSAQSGSPTTLTDSIGLNQTTDIFSNQASLRVEFSGGAEERCIRGFDAANDEVTVYPAFAQTVSTQAYQVISNTSCRNFP